MKYRLDSSAMNALYWSLEDLIGHGREWMGLTFEGDELVAIETNRGKFDMKVQRYER